MRCVICNRPTRGLLCRQHSRGYRVVGDGIVIKNNSRRLSKPEKLIIKILINNGLHPIFEVYFPWAKERANGVRLPFDIVLFKEKIIIEYDGRQHFEWIPFFHKRKIDWIKYKRRDKIKEILAKKNGWKVIRFNYRDKKLIDKVNTTMKSLLPNYGKE